VVHRFVLGRQRPEVVIGTPCVPIWKPVRPLGPLGYRGILRYTRVLRYTRILRPTGILGTA
jgi:hypothetical protein